MLVTVNSDDPVIFNTHAENELAYIYHALVHNGYEKEKILRWIDNVRFLLRKIWPERTRKDGSCV